jgi:hypothetical protein
MVIIIKNQDFLSATSPAITSKLRQIKKISAFILLLFPVLIECRNLLAWAIRVLEPMMMRTI